MEGIYLQEKMIEVVEEAGSSEDLKLLDNEGLIPPVPGQLATKSVTNPGSLGRL